MHRKIESFMNMAAEVDGRDGKGGMVHGVRSLGSATLDLAYTAMGSFDIWWEGGCWEWYVSFAWIWFGGTDGGIGMSRRVLLFCWKLGGWLLRPTHPRILIRRLLRMFVWEVGFTWLFGM